MFFDHLTIAGIIVVAFYALLPVLFGREFFRVDAEDDSSTELTSFPLSDETLQQKELSNSYSDC